jgi:hypothetical protein
MSWCLVGSEMCIRDSYYAAIGIAFLSAILGGSLIWMTK